jgi:uncharacterized protein
MSRDSSSAETLASLMPGDVRDYLLEHPEFLADNNDLLTVLIPPHKEHGDKVQDFQQFMLMKLQDHYTAIKNEHDDLMSLMQEHLQRQTRFNAAMLAILDAPDFPSMLRVITEDLPVHLDQEAVSIVLEAGEIFQKGIYGGLTVAAKGFVDFWLGEREIELAEQDTAAPELFGDRAEAIHSRALVRLNIDEALPTGLLALGHREAMYFATGLATEQLEFLGQVIERCFRKWMAIRG